MLEDEAMGKVYDRLCKVEKTGGNTVYEQEKYGQVVCEKCRKTKRQKEGKTERRRWRKGATDVAGPRAIQVIMV